jgi:hypothetical protein
MGSMRGVLPAEGSRRLTLVRKDSWPADEVGSAGPADYGLGFARGLLVAMGCSAIFALAALAAWAIWHWLL